MEEYEDVEELVSGAKGKQGELIVIGELLRNGWKVYLPMVDSGIDCIVDVGGGNYKEIQIKYREDRSIFTARSFKPRDNFYIVCYLSTRHRNRFWVIPSKTYLSLGTPTKAQGREYIQLGIGKEGSAGWNAVSRYLDNFNVLLAGASKEVRKAVQQASKRIKGKHFKQSDYEREILIMLAGETQPLKAREIISKLQGRLRSRFSEADLELTRNRIPRWEKTARFALYQGLKRAGLVETKQKNNWVLTTKGREEAKVAVREQEEKNAGLGALFG